MNDFKDELKKIAYEPARLLVQKLEENYSKLTIDQKIDLEKLKFGLKMFDLEEQQKTKTKGIKWEHTL